VRNLLGIPYLAGAERPDGADCWGLVRLASRQLFDRELPDIGRRGDPWTHARRPSVGAWRRVAGRVLPGDVVLLRMPGRTLHCGIVLEPGRMLHVLEGGTSRVDRLECDPWRGAIVGIYRWTG